MDIHSRILIIGAADVLLMALADVAQENGSRVWIALASSAI
jgi:hypothetical protein